MKIDKIIDNIKKDYDDCFIDGAYKVLKAEDYLRSKLTEAYEAGQKAQDEVWKNAVPDAIDGAFDKHLKNK